MISFLVNSDDTSRVRFALSPLGEAVSSIRMLASSARHQEHQEWVADVRPRLSTVNFRPLLALVPPTGYVPDFLTPPPPVATELIRPDIGAHLEVVRATSTAELVEEVTWMMTDTGTPAAWRRAAAPTHQILLDRPELALSVVVDLLARYWELALKPHWHQLRRGLQADVHSRMRVIESAGAGAVLSSLNESVGWQGDRLSVRSSYDFEEEMGGRGVVLVPSVFCGPEVLTMLPPLQPMIVYPGGSGINLWHPVQSRGGGPLAALLGAGRAAVLEALAFPSSTSDVAEDVGVTAGAVSQHLGVLRASGLITSCRAGRRVVHSLTLMGEDLIRGCRAPSKF